MDFACSPRNAFLPLIPAVYYSTSPSRFYHSPLLLKNYRLMRAEERYSVFIPQSSKGPFERGCSLFSIGTNKSRVLFYFIPPIGKAGEVMKRPRNYSLRRKTEGKKDDSYNNRGELVIIFIFLFCIYIYIWEPRLRFKFNGFHDREISERDIFKLFRRLAIISLFIAVPLFSFRWFWCTIAISMKRNLFLR